MPVIVNKTCLPQRVELFGIVADLHFNACHTVGVFTIRQVAHAAITMTGQTFRRAGRPRHGRQQHSGCRGNGIRQIQIHNAVFHAADNLGRDADNLCPAQNIVVVGAVAVSAGAGFAAALTQAYAGTRQDVCGLRRSQHNALDVRFGHGGGILVIVGRAALQLAAVALCPVAQPPCGQGKLLIAVVPQSFVYGGFTGQRDASVGADPHHGRFTDAACHATLRVQTAAVGGVPCHNAHRAIGGNVARHRHIAVAGIGAPTVIHIAGIFPFFQAQRQREAVDGGGFARDVKLAFTFQRKDVHSAIGKAQSITANVPRHQIFFGPVGYIGAGIGHKRCGGTAICQIVQRRTRVVGRNRVQIEAQRVGQFVPGFCHHGKPAAQKLIL